MSTPKVRPKQGTCRVVSVDEVSRFRFIVKLACGREIPRECANAPRLKTMACGCSK